MLNNNKKKKLSYFIIKLKYPLIIEIQIYKFLNNNSIIYKKKKIFFF